MAAVYVAKSRAPQAHPSERGRAPRLTAVGHVCESWPTVRARFSTPRAFLSGQRDVVVASFDKLLNGMR